MKVGDLVKFKRYKLPPMVIIKVDGHRAKYITFRGDKDWTAVKHLEVLSESR